MLLVVSIVFVYIKSMSCTIVGGMRERGDLCNLLYVINMMTCFQQSFYISLDIFLCTQLKQLHICNIN